MHRLMAPLMAQTASEQVSKGREKITLFKMVYLVDTTDKYVDIILCCFFLCVSADTSQNAVLLSHILDILSLCVERHTYHIRNYIIEKNILARVLVLMTSSHGHLVLGWSLK